VNVNLLTVYEEIIAFIERYCDLKKHKEAKRELGEDSPVESRREYHLYSVTEAVSNLLIHRDLALTDLPSFIAVFDDAIEFVNPRRTNGFVPPASRAIRFGITQRVNPQIASIFLRREYGLKLPHGGLPMIIKQSRLFSDRRVEIQTANDLFRLKVHGRT
jgi:predicted HTH transcriptional regulator